jgi:hypothetical protein
MSATDDERFAEIVAGFSHEPDQPVPPWPVAEDVGEDLAEDAAGAPPPVAEPVTQAPRPEADDEGLPGWLEPEALEDEGHFEPPPPPKVPRVRPRTAFAVGMLVLGLAVLFAPYRIGVDDSTGWIIIGLALTAGGAGLLVSGMRDAPPTDSGPDHGAVV